VQRTPPGAIRAGDAASYAILRSILPPVIFSIFLAISFAGIRMVRMVDDDFKRRLLGGPIQ
jgi:hypothetical protein